MTEKRQIAINWTGFLIAGANTGLLYYICWGLFNKQFTIDIKDPVMLALGVVLAKHGDILAWAFGSSSDARKKTDTIDKQADTIKYAQAALAPAPPPINLPPGESVTVQADGPTTPPQE